MSGAALSGAWVAAPDRPRLATRVGDELVVEADSSVSQLANNARANWSPASLTQSSRTTVIHPTIAATSTQIAPIAAGLKPASAAGIDFMDMIAISGDTAS